MMELPDLLKFKLNDGTQYSSTGVVDFLQPILDEYRNFSEVRLLIGDSGFLQHQVLHINN